MNQPSISSLPLTLSLSMMLFLLTTGCEKGRRPVDELVLKGTESSLFQIEKDPKKTDRFYAYHLKSDLAPFSTDGSEPAPGRIFFEDIQLPVAWDLKNLDEATFGVATPGFAVGHAEFHHKGMLLTPELESISFIRTDRYHFKMKLSGTFPGNSLPPHSFELTTVANISLLLPPIEF